jgi:hypothetical protein
MSASQEPSHLHAAFYQCICPSMLCPVGWTTTRAPASCDMAELQVVTEHELVARSEAFEAAIAGGDKAALQVGGICRGRVIAREAVARNSAGEEARHTLHSRGQRRQACSPQQNSVQVPR